MINLGEIALKEGAGAAQNAERQLKRYEAYQVMCEQRVFSACPDCKEDWDDCKCERINDDKKSNK